MIRLFFAAFAFLIVTSGPAFAEPDSATTGFVLQAVVGAIAAAGLLLRSHLQRLFSQFRRPEKSKQAAATAAVVQPRENDPTDRR